MEIAPSRSASPPLRYDFPSSHPRSIRRSTSSRPSPSDSSHEPQHRRRHPRINRHSHGTVRVGVGSRSRSPRALTPPPAPSPPGGSAVGYGHHTRTRHLPYVREPRERSAESIIRLPSTSSPPPPPVVVHAQPGHRSALHPPVLPSRPLHISHTVRPPLHEPESTSTNWYRTRPRTPSPPSAMRTTSQAPVPRMPDRDHTTRHDRDPEQHQSSHPIQRPTRTPSPLSVPEVVQPVVNIRTHERPHRRVDPPYPQMRPQAPPTEVTVVPRSPPLPSLPPVSPIRSGSPHFILPPPHEFPSRGYSPQGYRLADQPYTQPYTQPSPIRTPPGVRAWRNRSHSLRRSRSRSPVPVPVYHQAPPPPSPPPPPQIQLSDVLPRPILHAIPAPQLHEIRTQSVSVVAYNFITGTLPTQINLIVLLGLPSVYTSRLERVFSEAGSRGGVVSRVDGDPHAGGGSKSDHTHWYSGRGTGGDARPQPLPESSDELLEVWGKFIDTLIKEWETLNIISALLLSALLGVLQMDSAAANPIIRFSALISIYCAFFSLLFGVMYIIQFAEMKGEHTALQVGQDYYANRGTYRAGIWDFAILLSMPGTWLAWSMLLFLIAMTTFTWRTPTSNAPDEAAMLAISVLIPRIVSSVFLGLGAVYFFLMLWTLSRFGNKRVRGEVIGYVKYEHRWGDGVKMNGIGGGVADMGLMDLVDVPQKAIEVNRPRGSRSLRKHPQQIRKGRNNKNPM